MCGYAAGPMSADCCSPTPLSFLFVRVWWSEVTASRKCRSMDSPDRPQFFISPHSALRLRQLCAVRNLTGSSAGSARNTPRYTLFSLRPHPSPLLFPTVQQCSAFLKPTAVLQRLKCRYNETPGQLGFLSNTADSSGPRNGAKESQYDCRPRCLHR